VVALIVAQALVVAAVGLALGIFLASLGTRTITGLLYDVSAHDPWTYGTTAALLLVTAVLAALLPARRAARVDPMIAIRED
jgi:putative ABC transport system permease protein